LKGQRILIISRNESGENMSQVIIALLLDTFDGAKPQFLNRGKKRRSVSTLSLRPERSTELTPKSQAEGIPRASGRGSVLGTHQDMVMMLVAAKGAAVVVE